MIGLYSGIGVALLLSFFTILISPLLTVLTLKECGLLNNLTYIQRFIIFAFIYLVLASGVLLIIRKFSYESIDWLLLFTIIIGLFYVFLRLKKIRVIKSQKP